MSTGAGGPALVLVAVGAFFGGRLFLVAVLVFAAVALLEVASELSAHGPRPVLAAAAVAGLGVPLRVGLQPDDGLGAIPAVVAAMVLAAFALMVVTSRRREATVVVGSTSVCGLLVALGAGALVLLQEGPGGWRWIVGLVVAAAVVELVWLGGSMRALARSRSLRLVMVVLTTAPAAALLSRALTV